MSQHNWQYERFSRVGINALPRFGTGSAAALAHGVEPLSPSIGLYVHIPFCRSLCRFCMLRRGSSARRNVPEVFIDALEAEIRLAQPITQDVKVGALYFGGGTPSLLSAAQVERLMGALRHSFIFENTLEITFEGEATSLCDTSLLMCLRDNGVQRVSFGLQTFDEDLRRLLGRFDTVADLYRLREALERISIPEINVDYLYCLPGTEIEFVTAELAKLHSYSVSSVDCHPLKYASCSRHMLNTIKVEGRRVPNAALRIAFFELIRESMLSAGFAEQFVDQYTRNAPATTNRYMRYLYGLDGGEYLGLGPGARSHFGDYGFQNVTDYAEYQRLLSTGVRPVSKSVHAPLSDNFVCCFPKRNDILSEDQVNGAASNEYLRGRLDHLRDGGFVELSGEGYSMTPQGLRWYQNLQEDLLSETQRGLHLKTVNERQIGANDFNGYFESLGVAET